MPHGAECGHGYIAVAKDFHDHIWSNDAPRAWSACADSSLAHLQQAQMMRVAPPHGRFGG